MYFINVSDVNMLLNSTVNEIKQSMKFNSSYDATTKKKYCFDML